MVSFLINSFTRLALDIPKKFRCTYSNVPLGDPVASSKCQHLFEKSQLDTYLQDHPNCPKCFKKIKIDDSIGTTKQLKYLKTEIQTHIKHEVVKVLRDRILMGMVYGGLHAITARFAAKNLEIENHECYGLATIHSAALGVVILSVAIRYKADSTASRMKTLICGASGGAMWFGGIMTDLFYKNTCQGINHFTHLGASLLIVSVHTLCSQLYPINFSDIE
jgi:hypothetical protein